VSPDFEKLRWDAASLLISSAVWFASVYGSHQFFGSMQFGVATFVLSIPAGLRLILLLILGGWEPLGFLWPSFSSSPSKEGTWLWQTSCCIPH